VALSKLAANSFDLTDDYALTGTVTGANSTQKLFLIKNIDASSDSTISFVDGSNSVVLDNTYKTYLFKFINMHSSSDEQNFTVGFRDGGSDYDAVKTTTYFEAIHNQGDTATNLAYQASLDLAQSTGFQLCLRFLGTDNDQSASGQMYLFNPSSTTFVKHFMITGSSDTSSEYLNNHHIAGYCNTTTAIDGVQFKMASGNIDAGRIALYGIK
jgi:flavin-binding protein dodecin